MNEQTRQRFEEWFNEHDGRVESKRTPPTMGDLKAAWNAQNEYWSKRVEEMERALKWLADYSYELFQTDRCCMVIEDRIVIAEGSTPLEAIQNAMKCDSRCDSKDGVLPSKVRVAPSDKSDEERKD